MKQDVQNQQTKRGNPYVGFLWVILIVLLLNNSSLKISLA